MKNVIVIGGGGFIGLHLVNRLCETAGVENVVVYDLNPQVMHTDEPRRVKPFAVKGDANDDGLLLRAMDGCDTVFHLAANPDISKGATDPGLDFWRTTALTHCVLEAMRETGAQRLFYTSGSGVYGDLGETPVAEDMPARPVSPYGAAKAASEAMIHAYSAMFGIRASIFRFANVVGPRQTHGVAYDFIRKLRADPTKLEILGDGEQSKSYVHVSDVLDAMFLVSTMNQVQQCEVWNVATKDYISVRQIAALVVAAMSLVFKHPDITYTGGAAGWKGDVPVIRFNCDKIRALGWRPQHGSGTAMWEAILAMVRE